MTVSTLLKIISFLVCVIIVAGLAYRRKRKIHARLMMTAFGIDVALVLYIELTRKAVETALHPPHPFVIFHVAISVLVLLLYGVQIFLGMRLMRGGASTRLHGRVGLIFVVLRLANFVTSLSVENFVRHS